jgi:hypothetical protein
MYVECELPHSGGYEEFCLVGSRNIMQRTESMSRFQRNISASSAGETQTDIQRERGKLRWKFNALFGFTARKAELFKITFHAYEIRNLETNVHIF